MSVYVCVCVVALFFLGYIIIIIVFIMIFVHESAWYKVLYFSMFKYMLFRCLNLLCLHVRIRFLLLLLLF